MKLKMLRPWSLQLPTVVSVQDGFHLRLQEQRVVDEALAAQGAVPDTVPETEDAMRQHL